MIQPGLLRATVIAFLAFETVSLSASADPKPNIILIVADDLGWRDLGVLGAADFKTPHIDSLATNGVRFTSGYVTAPICSPSRAGLMTGRYQQRFGHETNPGTDLETNPIFGLPLTETTMGNRLKSLGYATGWIGKSHLGGMAPFHPLQRGFDEFFGFIQSHHQYIRPDLQTVPDDPILRGTADAHETNYLTSAFQRECLDFIDRHTNAPFFLYAPFNATHFPLQATSNLFARFSTNDFSDLNRYTNAAVLAGLDDAVGAILSRLSELKLETNTFIFFTSDNGGATNFGSVNLPLRGGKTEVYEGGLRVPFIMQWKNHLPANAVREAPVSTLDILPTAITAAGGMVPAAWQLDGVNLLPYATNPAAAAPHATLFWRVETDGINEGSDADVKDGVRAVRQGGWKLVKSSLESSWELYNLVHDPGEATNLASAQPDVVRQLVAAYDEWNAQLARPLWARNKTAFAAPDYVREDIRLGSTNVSYLDPEFLPGGEQVAFQNETNSLWVGDIDPLTGYLVTASGLDLHVDSGLAPPASAIEGPQWGLSTNSPALFYTKTGSNGRLQVWRARAVNNILTPAQLTTSATNLFGTRDSQEGTNASVKMIFNVGNPATFTAAYADENLPSSVFALPLHVGGVWNGSWIPGSADLTYGGILATQSVAQIARYRTATHTAELVTLDADDKSDACAFLAPELNGELLYAAVANRTNIAIYRDLHDNPNGSFTNLVTITLPADATQRFIHSLRPLPGGRGFNGVSYFSCAAYQNDNPLNPGDGAMWLLGIGADANSALVRRVDDGAFSGVMADRREPKTFIGAHEVFYYFTQLDGTNAVQLRLAQTGLKLPDHPSPPSGFTSLQFTRSFAAGTNDTNGNPMNSTEIMNLVAHQGRLYAGQSSTKFYPYPTDSEITNKNPAASWSGAQILVKDSPTSAWRVDDSNTNDLFRIHLRVDALTEIKFITGNGGTTNLLICGLLDIGNIGSTLASARVREDETGRWYESQVTLASEPASVLSFGSHANRIFAGLSNGEIHRGSFDPGSPGKLDWVANSWELSGVGPVTSFAECEGKLYAACGLRQTGSNAPVTGGLYVRNDGGPEWQLVHRWPHPVEIYSRTNEDFLLRGLTTVPEPHGASNEVLIAARAWPGVIERLDPAQTNAVTIELDVRDFFARRWNDDRVRQAPVTIAYNGFTAATNPVTGERVHLVGVWIEHPDTNAPSHNGSHFLIRHLDATYESADILADGAGGSLRATRAIAVSPFAEDRGASFYFAGYDVANNVSTNTAWIRRGDWLSWPALTLTRPNPPDWQLAWPRTDNNWLLESSTALGAGANWQTVPGLPTRSITNETQSVNSQTSAAFFRLRQP